MIPAGVDEGVVSGRASQVYAVPDVNSVPKTMVDIGPGPVSGGKSAKHAQTLRRTPRVSLIVVLPENHVITPDRLAEGLRAHGDEKIDVVVACAGQPANLSALQLSVGDAQFLLAPVGTSIEDLRELAMRQVPGDIVMLLSGALVDERATVRELSMTS